MITRTLVNDKPRWDWEDPFTFSVTHGELKDGSPTFIANLATEESRWAKLKMRHIGPYYVVRKIVHAILLTAIVGAGAYAVWWFISNIGWDYKQVTRGTYIVLHEGEDGYRTCDDLGFSGSYCNSGALDYYNQKYVDITEWVPYWDWWWTTIKHVGRGVVGIVGLRLAWISVMPLSRTLKALYKDLRTRFARTKGEARHFNVYKDRVTVFENALELHIKRAAQGSSKDSRLENVLNRMANMSVEEFNAEIGELSMLPITSGEVLRLFRDSINGEYRPVLTEACEGAVSLFMVGIDQLWKEKNSFSTSRDDRDRLGKRIRAIAEKQSQPIAELLANAIMEQRIQAVVEEAKSRYLEDRSRADNALRISAMIEATDHLT